MQLPISSIGPLKFLVLAFLFSACGNSMPKELPEDLRIDLNNSGGMLPESYSYKITNDSVSLLTRYYGYTNRYAFVPTAEQMDELWKTLQEQNAIAIKSRDEGEVMDRGGTSIHIRYGGKDHKISNSGNYFIEPAWRENWQQVNQAIGSLVWDGMEGEKRKVQMSFSYADSLPEIKYLDVMIGPRSLTTYNLSDTTELPVRAEKMMLTGLHSFSVQVTFTNEETLHLDRTGMQVGENGARINLRVTPEEILRTGAEIKREQLQ